MTKAREKAIKLYWKTAKERCPFQEEEMVNGFLEGFIDCAEYLLPLIEKMKCCGNCKYFDFNEPNYCHKGVYREKKYVCSEWEFGD